VEGTLSLYQIHQIDAAYLEGCLKAVAFSTLQIAAGFCEDFLIMGD
jgi:hypothetical protein